MNMNAKSLMSDCELEETDKSEICNVKSFIHWTNISE